MLVNHSAIIYHSCSSIINTFNICHSDLLVRTQEGHDLRHLLFRDFALRWLANFHHFLIYAIIFGLTRCSTHGPWRHLCWRLAEIKKNCHLWVTCMDRLRLWYNHVAGLIPHSTTLAFVTKRSEKLKFTSNVIQVKKRRRRIGIEETVNVITDFNL